MAPRVEGIGNAQVKFGLLFVVVVLRLKAFYVLSKPQAVVGIGGPRLLRWALVYGVVTRIRVCMALAVLVAATWFYLVADVISYR